MDVVDVVRANVLNATSGSGGFSQWTGQKTLQIKLSTLRRALDGSDEEKAAAKLEIAGVLAHARPKQQFTSWGGMTGGSGICALSVAELCEFCGVPQPGVEGPGAT